MWHFSVVQFAGMIGFVCIVVYLASFYAKFTLMYCTHLLIPKHRPEGFVQAEAESWNIHDASELVTGASTISCALSNLDLNEVAGKVTSIPRSDIVIGYVRLLHL